VRGTPPRVGVFAWALGLRIARMVDVFDALRAEEQHQLRALVRKMGERAACEALGIARSTLARALAGLPVRRGSVALLRARLTGNADLARKLGALERKYDAQFKAVFDAIRELAAPPPKPRRPIGFRS
jgi:hypothetical protein